MRLWKSGRNLVNMLQICRKKRGGVVREGLPKDPNMGSEATLAWGLE